MFHETNYGIIYRIYLLQLYFSLRLLHTPGFENQILYFLVFVGIFRMTLNEDAAGSVNEFVVDKLGVHHLVAFHSALANL